jgi:hypothetical protein
VRIAGEIVEGLVGASEALFSVDHPRLGSKGRDKGTLACGYFCSI